MRLFSVLFLSILNAKSLKYSSYLNNISTICKTSALLLVIIIGIINLVNGKTENFKNSFDPIDSDSSFSISRLASAFYAGMWAYDGWDSLNYIAEEIRNPGKTFPRVV